jgi:hypothetical protein
VVEFSLPNRRSLQSQCLPLCAWRLTRCKQLRPFGSIESGHQIPDGCRFRFGRGIRISSTKRSASGVDSLPARAPSRSVLL